MAIIGIEHLSAQINEELTIYSKEVTEKLKTVAKEYSAELVKRTKATAPVGNRKSNKYRDSIKSKKLNESDRGVTYVWYVDSKNSNYRLTHLLVNGHAERNGGRTTANPFLQRATDAIEQEYIKAIEEVIRNG